MRKKRKYQRPKPKYPKEIEATWYVMIQFISSFDYVVRYTDINEEKQHQTANPNCVLSAKISKNSLLEPISIGKYMLEEHFNRNTILFYKCAPNKKLSTGYGKYDKEAQALPFSTDLNITTKKDTDKTYFVLLIGIDIDCHNGENHVKDIEELIKKYLPHTYWEDSTNGKGRHGYLKIKFKNSFGVLETISNCLKKLFSKLNELKNAYGYEAHIDDPAGLPYTLEFSDINPYNTEWTTLFHYSGKENKFLGRHINPKSTIWKDYITYLKDSTIHHIPEKCYYSPSKLHKYLSDNDIQTTFSQFLSDRNISFSPPTKNNKFYKITVQRAFKLPLFGANATGDSPVLPRMSCIKEFYNLPYYTSSDLKAAYGQIWSDLKGISHFSVPVRPSGANSVVNSVSHSVLKTDADTFPILKKEEDKASSAHSRCSFVTETSKQTTETVKNPVIKKREERIGYNCACTNTLLNTENRPESENNKPIYAESIPWSDICNDTEEFDIDQFWQNYQQNRQDDNITKYEDIIDKLKTETNTMIKSTLFIRAFIHKIGRIPTVDEAEREYVSQNLNRNSALVSQNRRNRFKSCISYYEKEYDISETGFSPNWSEEKDEVLALMKSHLSQQLVYKQGKRIKTITLEEIGFVYQIIKKMEQLEQDYILANSLSYHRADELFLEEFGKKCGRHKFSGILKILLESGLIEKCRNYKVGLRGNCYQVKAG